MSVQAVVIDIDHTLMHPARGTLQLQDETLWLHQQTRLLITQLRAQGKTVIIASARRVRRALAVARAVDADWTIAENGGVILTRDGTPDASWAELLRPYIGDPQQHRGRTGILWDHAQYLEREGYTVTAHERIASFRITGDQQTLQHVEALPLPQGLKTTWNLGFLDFIPALSGKDNALRRITNHLGIPRRDTAMIGDDSNDLEVLRCVGHPCTLNGAHPEVIAFVRARGGFVARSEQHDGIQEVLRFLVSAAAADPVATPGVNESDEAL